MRIIRTQGEKEIVVADRVSSICMDRGLSENSMRLEIVAYFQVEDCHSLGTYGTRERCVGVLDMLGEWLSMEERSSESVPSVDKRNRLQGQSSDKPERIHYSYTYASFQMPEDDEWLDIAKAGSYISE